MSDGFELPEILAALPLRARRAEEFVGPLAALPCFGPPLSTARFPTAEEL